MPPKLPILKEQKMKSVLRHELISYPTKWGRKTIEREVIYRGS